MNTEKNKSLIDTVAKSNGYAGKIELLQDYGFVPTVMVPGHKRIEIVPLLWKHLTGRKVSPR